MQRRPQTDRGVSGDPGQGFEQTHAALRPRREMRAAKAVLRQEQADAAPGAQREVGDRTGDLDGELEAGVGLVPCDGRRRRVEQHGDVAARRVVHLAQHQVAGPGGRFPVDAAERLAGVVRSHAAELGGAERGQAAQAAFASRPHAGEERARRELG